MSAHSFEPFGYYDDVPPPSIAQFRRKLDRAARKLSDEEVAKLLDRKRGHMARAAFLRARVGGWSGHLEDRLQYRLLQHLKRKSTEQSK